VAGLVAQEWRLFDLQPGLGDLMLRDALVGQRPAEGQPGLGALGEQRQGALGGAEGAHAVVDTAGAEADRGGGDPAALLADDVGDRAVVGDVRRDEFAPASQALHVLPIPWVEVEFEVEVEVEDVTAAALFLASPEARYITGVTLPVDAGALIK
jgi:Enoyl-(Acyl carrier protein) reductase